MKITTYNVPFEQSSRDRIVNPALLDKYKVEDVDLKKFSYLAEKSVNAIFTITGKKFNYIKIDETPDPAEKEPKPKIFRTPITYWFATMKSIESSEAITYDCKLDVVLTYFLSEVHQQLDGDDEQVHVLRFHDKRYKIDGTDIVLDPEFMETKVGEFNYKGKNGNVIKYKPNTVNDIVFDYVPIDALSTYIYEDIANQYNSPFFYYKGHTTYYYDQTDPRNPVDKPFTYPLGGADKFWMVVKNEYGKVVYNDWIWNIAEGFQTLETITLLDGGKLTMAMNTIIWDNRNKNRYIVVITTDRALDGKKDSITGFARKGIKSGQASGLFTVDATYNKDDVKWEYKKVNNAFFKNGQRYFSYAILQSKEITNTAQVSQILTNGSHITIAPIDLMGIDSNINSLKKFEDLGAGAVLNIFLSPFQLDFMPFYEWTGAIDDVNTKKKQLFFKPIKVGSEIYFGYIDQDQFKVIEDIIGNDVELFKDDKIILKAPNNNDTLNMINKWDIAIIPNIPFTQHVSQFSQELDIVNYNFFERNKIDVITNELGLNYKIFNNKYKYSLFTENNYISFFTNQASSYLATHKGQIEAQRKRIDLEKDLSIKGVQSSMASNFGGGVLGGFMASMNPASYVNLSLLGDTKQMYRDIAQNKKDTIQAQIDDLKNTPSISNLGNEHTLNVMQPTGNGEKGIGQFFLEIELPNKVILSKINQYLKRYGYKYDGYLTFGVHLWDTRETFNFLSIKDIRDELTADDEFDNECIELMDDELEKGIRIWHKTIGEFGQRNLEKNILPPRKK